MKISTKLPLLPVVGTTLLALTSCEGILGDIYNDPDTAPISPYGFVVPATRTQPGTIYIDATSYAHWVYIDFRSMSAETIDVSEPAPTAWDIAVHRYDVKTNGATATVADGFDFASASGTPVADVHTTETIITDMSGMMSGHLSYIESDHNPCLSSWLDVDTSVMPPVYTLSGDVYMVNLPDGRRVALRLDDFMDDSGTKGFLTISYLPAEND